MGVWASRETGCIGWLACIDLSDYRLDAGWRILHILVISTLDRIPPSPLPAVQIHVLTRPTRLAARPTNTWYPVSQLPGILPRRYLVPCLNASWCPVSLLPGILAYCYLVRCLTATYYPVSLPPCTLCHNYLVPCLTATLYPVSLLLGTLSYSHLVFCLTATWYRVSQLPSTLSHCYLVHVQLLRGGMSRCFVV